MATVFDLPRHDPLRLASYVRKYGGSFWTQAAAGITYNTVIVAGPILLGKVLDAAATLQREGVTPHRVRTLLFFASAFVLVTLFFQYARYLKRWHLWTMANSIACDMRAGILSRVLLYPMARAEQESVGDLMSRTVGDVDQVTNTMRQVINETWDTWLLMISYFAVLLYYDWRITLICSIPIPLSILAAESVRHPLYRLSMNARAAAAVVTSHVQKTLSGLPILRLFGREGVETERLKDYSRTQMKWNIKTTLLQTAMMPVYATLASLGIIGVILMGGGRVVDGTWTIGTFAAYLTMFTLMATRTWVAARVFNQFHAASASWKRIKDKLGEDGQEAAQAGAARRLGPEQAKAGNPAATPQASLHNSQHDDSVPIPSSERLGESGTRTTPHLNPLPQGERRQADGLLRESPLIQVNGLSFSFPGAKTPALHDISFTIGEGDFVGVTGPVGCGKSALALALTGLYPYSGEVLIGGRALSALSATERVSTFAYAGEDAFLFSASIRENVTFQQDGLIAQEAQRLEAALYIAALSDDMPLFPQGLDTLVGERGVRLSGGQRQRLALARAIFPGNPVLILDDPFSAVDIGTEQRMVERIKKDLKGATILVFSHRLAAFTDADSVLVLDRGRLIEQGDHKALMAAGGMYQKIYSAQTWMESEKR